MIRLNPNIICLVETKSNLNRIYHFYTRFSRDWDWAAMHACGLSEGIIFLWSRAISTVTPIVTTRLSLHLLITKENNSWILSVMYNSQVISGQKNLLAELIWYVFSKHPLAFSG